MNVFLVDDSSFINLVCRQSLKQSGIAVIGEAFDGEEAVKKILELKPEVVVMDIALPKKNGLEATKEILKAAPATKVIAISALEEEWVQAKALEAGCIYFLQKPFTAKDFVETVKTCFDATGELKYG